MKNQLFVDLIAVLASANALADSSFHASGRVFSDVYAPVIMPATTPFPYTGASAWLQGDARFGDATSARAILEADATDSVSPGIGGAGYGLSPGTMRANLREGWVDYSHLGFGFRFGRQIIPWGKSDVINPTDFLSAKDYTVFNPDDEVRRIGATSLEGTFTPAQGASPLTLTIVWTPVAPESRLLLPPGVVPAPVTLSSSTLAPDSTVSNSELALKAAYQGEGWDASVLAFRGYNHLPELAETAPATLAPAFHAIRAAGGDCSFSPGGLWTFRGESAYVWTRNDDGMNPLIEPSHLDAVLGAERPFWGGSSFRAQGQLYWRYIPRFTAPDQGIAEANALLLNTQDRSRTAGTLRLAYAEDGMPWEAEAFGLVNFVGGDYLLRPKLAYAWSDALRTSVGMEYYGGPEDRPIGALHGYSAVFAEGKLVF